MQPLKIVKRKLTDLHLDPANARKHDEKNLASILGSLRQFGQVEPLVVQKGTGKIIGGNGRYSAMMQLGWESANVVEVELDDLHATALGIALNRTAELAEWDLPVLESLLVELRNDSFALEGIGFDDDDLKRFIHDDGDMRMAGGGGDDAPPPEEVKHVKMVQLFFNEEQHSMFMAMTDTLTQRYGTGNITDTIMLCVEYAHAQPDEPQTP